MDETLLRQLHSSLCVTWGTTSPYTIGRVYAQETGFARLPSLIVDVTVPEQAIDALVPIVRQRVYAELAERGWTDHVIAFSPSVRAGRRRLFVDGNESSESCGRRKYGLECEYRFDIVSPEFKTAVFHGKAYAYTYTIPERGGTPE